MVKYYIEEEMDFMNLNLPNHVAIILDGNGRWAKKRLMPRTFGHKAGADNLVELSKYCNRIGLKNLTVFAFSTFQVCNLALTSVAICLKSILSLLPPTLIISI